MIEPKEILIDNRVFILSKFPAVAGRDIVTQYPLSGVPKLGNYKTNEEIMLKLMCYVAIPREAPALPLALTSQALIDNHVGGWETLVKVEWAMMEYNCSFFRDGRASSFLAGIAQQVPAWLTKMWTALLGQSLQTEKPHSTN